ELRDRLRGSISSSGRLYRQNPQRREAHRPAGNAVDQIRAGHQPSNCAIARDRGAPGGAFHRRRGDRVNKRAFISLLGGAAAAWPLAARAQQQTMLPVVGFLSSSSPRSYAPMVAAFRQGLKEVGYVEGQNVAIEFGWAENDLSRLPMLAADLIRQAAVVATSGGYAPTHAAKGATATIPI